MDQPSPWVDDASAALLTDLYQLTMLQAYWRRGMDEEAVFSLFFRTLPPRRNFVLACGISDVLRYLERLRFGPEALAWLEGSGGFRRDFLDWLGELRFAGDVRAVPEGTPVFAGEPLVEVTAPLPQAQLVESFLMNQICFQTTVAAKGARVVLAAAGRPVVDFGMRRTHGTDAAMKVARACWIAGVAATSNVLAGRVWGIPVTGTMAHSYVQAHDDEMDALRSFAELYPETTLLVDTYDTLRGIDRVVTLAGELGEAFRVRAVRLDSGDLAALSRGARQRLDAAGLGGVQIFASGGLDEDAIAGLVAAGAPVDGFGVGTSMGVSADAPTLDMAYKLTSYAGRGRTKTSAGKPVLPGPQQVFRRDEEGEARGDTVGRSDERLAGRPLLVEVMRAGRLVGCGAEPLAAARERAAAQIAALPQRLRRLDPATPPYPVAVSEALAADARAVRLAAASR